MFKSAKERLMSLGYDFKSPSDKPLLAFAVQKAENTVKNECNLSEIPEGLFNIAVDMAAGEFLLAKKTFAPADIEGLDLDFAVKSLQVGDTSTSFAVGEGSQTAEQRLDCLINRLLNSGREQFSCYRRLKW